MKARIPGVDLNRLIETRDRLVVPADRVEGGAQNGKRYRITRIELDRAFRLDDRGIVAVRPHMGNRQHGVGVGVGLIEFDGFARRLECLFGGIGAIVAKFEHEIAIVG